MGAWELVSYEVRGSDGDLLDRPLGTAPAGIIAYTEDGFMSAQLMSRDRPAFDEADPLGGTSEQTVAAARGYLAYAGPFELDEASGTFYHHVSVSLLPNWIGQPQIRHGHVGDGTLTLAADIDHAGQSARATLVWRRPTR